MIMFLGVQKLVQRIPLRGSSAVVKLNTVNFTPRHRRGALRFTTVTNYDVLF